jgi:hypothetical protein
MSRPNLFRFATSELSQDAFFCYLASCAEDSVSDLTLRKEGREFLQLLLSGSRVELPDSIRSLQIRRQLKNTDVVIEINDDLVILIEDKAGSADHSNQLFRYLEDIRTCYPDRMVVPVYIQTYLQSNFESVSSAGYEIVGRSELLKTLRRDSVDTIVRQFWEHLDRLNQDYESYRSGSNWSIRGWAQYISRVAGSLEGCRWHRVSNPQGGFFAAYWGWTEISFGSLYLQLGETRLSLRIVANETTTPDDIWGLYQDALSFSEWEVPKRMKPKSGKTQNLINLEMDHRRFDAVGNIQVDETVSLLQEYTHKMKRFAESLGG